MRGLICRLSDTTDAAFRERISVFRTTSLLSFSIFFNLEDSLFYLPPTPEKISESCTSKNWSDCFCNIKLNKRPSTKRDETATSTGSDEPEVLNPSRCQDTSLHSQKVSVNLRASYYVSFFTGSSIRLLSVRFFGCS
jgi:hypothetical protein